MTVTVKTPFIPSTSGYQPNVTWSQSSIPVAAALCRATLGIGLKDSVFPGYWQQWGASKTPRSAYHFLKNKYGSADQAKFFVNYIKDSGGILVGDKLCLDVEDTETDASISAVIDFLYNVQVLTNIASKDLLIYSRADILNAPSFSKLSQGQKDYLLSIPTWIAGYPNDPNPYNFSQLANIYRADPLRYGKCVIVQYAESVEILGISNIDAKSTECNVADPDYLLQWQIETGEQPDPPPGDPPMETVIATGKVIPVNLNIRSTPDSSGTTNLLGKLNANDVIDIVEYRTDKWIRFTKITRGTSNVALPASVCWCFAGSTNGYVEVTMITNPPPPPPPSATTIELTLEQFVDGVKYIPEVGNPVKFKKA